MPAAFAEHTFSMFDRGMAGLDLPAASKRSNTEVRAHRGEDLDVVVEFVDVGERQPRPPRGRAGEVRRADKSIPLVHIAGGTGVLEGVSYHGQRTDHRRDGPTVTTSTLSAQAIDWDLSRGREAAFVVEWLLNLPDGLIFPDGNDTEAQEVFVRKLGEGDARIRMRTSARSSGMGRALHLNVEGTDLYLFTTEDTEGTGRHPGQMVFRGCPQQARRDRIRHCLSFILGRPLVYLGHTEYDADWSPTRMRSVSAVSAGGAMFRLAPLPPYPLAVGSQNLVDQKRTRAMVVALIEHYDTIGFRDLSWSYWYAACAPFHSAAVHFGGILEQLQRRCLARLPEGDSELLSAKQWAGLQEAISSWLATAGLEPEVHRILKGKVSGLNRAPPNLVLKRVLDGLGLAIGEVEMDAWRHRNHAAHGSLPSDPVATIRGNKLLQGLFNRMIAAVTGCSRQYIDYYSLDHPHRALGMAVPDDRPLTP